MFDKFLGICRGDSFKNVLERNREIGPGFDMLRIILSVALLVLHARWAAGGSGFGQILPGLGDLAQETLGTIQTTVKSGFTKPLRLMLVPAFFALSGFLVTGSAFRLRVTSTFLMHRFLRIFPALIVEVFLSAFVLGAFLTTLPLKDYFSHHQFYRYCANSLGFVSFVLPGVFENNIIKDIVNANLWTLPSEFHCYFVTALLLVTKTIYNRKLYTIAFVLSTIGLAIAHYMTGMSAPTQHYLPHVVVYYFFVGVLAYHYKEKIPASFGLFFSCAVMSYVGTSFDSLVYFAAFPLTYCVLFIGMVDFGKLRLKLDGDYSYGIYLYGFPITQAYLNIFPKLSEHKIPFIFLVGITTLFSHFCLGMVSKKGF